VLWAYPTSMRSYFQVGKEGAAGRPVAAAAAAAAPPPGPARTAAQHRTASRAQAKSAVGSFLRWAHPLPTPALAAGIGEDEADALLAAMYCLAQEVEWRALRLQGGAAFWGLLDARLATARLGKLGGEAANGRAAVRAALAELHAASLGVEQGKRATPSATPGQAAGEHSASAPAGQGEKAKGKARRAKGSSGAASGAAASGAALDPLALERLYKRQRLAFSEEVRSVLLGSGPGALWGEGAVL
jgi:hypothetical protein